MNTTDCQTAMYNNGAHLMRRMMGNQDKTEKKSLTHTIMGKDKTEKKSLTHTIMGKVFLSNSS